ncbi:hypothetical protein CBR_g45637 [Chara braunii]|uniref:FAD-binding FR-type domain-containing protein n=1 Tax=Chara braunii TaxID=69332 RepID=A0A388K3J8_CHABU|nr:hypothetical protein CBR_g45637 [Chara braunii]|eukprot:GBG64579.1 hypothetical protein CBR_g45637 [Chara braunii]
MNIGWGIMATLIKYMEPQPSESVQILRNAQATSLIVNRAQHVVGVNVTVEQKGHSGDSIREEMRIFADAVVLATGGYAADREGLLKEYVPPVIRNLATTNGPFATGDGVKIAKEIGAGLIHMDQVQVHPTGCVDPKDPANLTKFLAPESLRGCGGILLNQKGERFVNELTTWDAATKAIMTECERLPLEIVKCAGGKINGVDVVQGNVKNNDHLPISAYMLITEESLDKFDRATGNFYIAKGFIQRFENATEFCKAFALPKDAVVNVLENYGKQKEDPYGKTVFPQVLTMEGELPGGAKALTTLERNTVVAALSVVAMLYRIERTTTRLRMRSSIHTQSQLMQQVMDAPDCVSLSESIVQFCCAMASGVIPWATPRWWMRRRTGGTWEDLRQVDDAAEGYYKEKLWMSPRVFLEIVEALSPVGDPGCPSSSSSHVHRRLLHGSPFPFAARTPHNDAHVEQHDKEQEKSGQRQEREPPEDVCHESQHVRRVPDLVGDSEELKEISRERFHIHSRNLSGLIPTEYTALALIQRYSQSKSCAVLRFALPSKNHVLGLLCGQYLAVRAQPRTPSEQPIVRYYSPLTPADEFGFFELVIKHHQAASGSMPDRMMSLPIGGTLEFAGPLGRFTYEPNMYEKVGMIAGGTGIAPMMQIIRTVIRHPADNTHLSLLYGNAFEDEIACKEELMYIAETRENVRVRMFLEHPPLRWRMGRGYVTEEVIKESMPAPGTNSRIVMCGPAVMMKVMKETLHRLRYPDHQIYIFNEMDIEGASR